MAAPGQPTGKRIKTRYVGVYFLYGKDRICANGKPDKCFYITYKDKGKAIFEKVGWRSEGYTIQDAIDLRGLRVRERRHPELFGKPQSPPVPPPTGITVEEAWVSFRKHWLPNLKDQYGVIRTYERYIRPNFGSRHILALTELEVETFKQELLAGGAENGRGLQQGTVQKVLALLKRIVNKAFKWNLVEGKNPLSGVSVKNIFSKRERYLSRKEAEQILDGLSFVSCELYHISRIALNTGLRLSEILKLQGNDINIDQGIILIRDGKTGERTAYIPQYFEKELERLIPLDKSNFLFSNKKGEMRNSKVVSTSFAKFMNESGLNKNVTDGKQKIVFHTFRHTFCSWLAIAGVPLYTIAKLAGHKTISMTQRYAKLSPAIQREALERLAFK